MINFRYHLVSLVAVFLALAVGVVLGAGPLQNAIHRAGDDSGEASLDPQAQEVLTSAQAEGAAGQSLASAIGQDVLPDSIPATKVTLVALPGAGEQDLSPTVEALELAGADVLGSVQVTQDFVSQDANTYRETLSGPVSGHLSSRPSSPSPALTLAMGLVDALVHEGSEADLVRDLLTDETTPLVVGESVPTERAEALVLVGPGVARDSEGESEEQAQLAPLTKEAWIALADAFAGSGLPAVAVGQAAKEQDFVSVLRAANTALATADRGGSPMGALNAALVIATGAQGAFGTQQGATTVLAPLPGGR